ncbi:11782_t:CDS:2, partial [Cetraspora pellucida]
FYGGSNLKNSNNMDNTDDMEDLYVEIHSEAETMSTAPSASSANSLTHQNDSSVAYCKICENNLSGTRHKPYPYTRKCGNTTNLINHLHDKHNITKENYTEFLDEHNEPRHDQTKITEYAKTATPCSSKWQELITQMLISFIIKFIHKEQLCILLSNNVVAIHLTTDLWTAKSRHGYLAQKLCEAQKNSECLLEDNYHNLLDVLTDVKTRWNSPDRKSQQEKEKLEQLFLQDALKLLLLFEKITRRICGAKYCTLSLVHPYIELLKKLFEPNYESGETYDTYLDLIYGPQSENDNEEVEESDSSTSDEDEIPSGGSRKHWQYAHHIDDFNNVEYLPAANTVGLLQKVRAAIFLSLDELWSAPSDLVRITTILDPRFKDFKWDNTDKEKDEALKLLQIQYDSAKENSQTSDIYTQPTQQTTPFHDCTDDDDDFFQALE